MKSENFRSIVRFPSWLWSVWYWICVVVRGAVSSFSTVLRSCHRLWHRDLVAIARGSGTDHRSRSGIGRNDLVCARDGHRDYRGMVGLSRRSPARCCPFGPWQAGGKVFFRVRQRPPNTLAKRKSSSGVPRLSPWPRLSNESVAYQRSHRGCEWADELIWNDMEAGTKRAGPDEGWHIVDV